MKNKLLTLASLVALGAGTLCSCTTRKMDSAGYTIKHNWQNHLEYKFQKEKNEVRAYDGKYVLYDGGHYELDGKVDLVGEWTWAKYSLKNRNEISEEQAKGFDELLAKYKKSLNVAEAHKEWEKRYTK